MFYLVCRSLEERTNLISYLKDNGVLAVFHYFTLHLSDYYKRNNDNIPILPNCDMYAVQLVRLPLYFELNDEEVDFIINSIK